MSEASSARFPQGPLRLSPLLVTSYTAPFVWRVPGSKSITNRALLLAALAEGTTTLRGVLHSDDTRHMRNALAQMGIEIVDLDATSVQVHGGRSKLRAPDGDVFVGNSGTTVRFLTAFCALVPGRVTLVGDEHMAKRPIMDLVEGLRQLGVRVDCPSGCPPLTIYGGELPGGQVSMPGDKSSQYFSALLMAAQCAQSDLTVQATSDLVSRPYNDITLSMMQDFGANVPRHAATAGANSFTVPSLGAYTAREYVIEPDASSASYAFATAAATGLTVRVPGLSQGALQGDYDFVHLLKQMGCRVESDGKQTSVVGSGPLRALDVDMHHISDTVMTLAALAPLCQGTTHITNVYNIRIKETDRLAATVTELQRLGQAVTAGHDWLRIDPRPVLPCVVQSYSDHRMAMAFAVLGLCRDGVQIENPACVAKTYPTFWDDLRGLYAHCGQPCPY
jgi:3-phosphoshikimate 1-carboxyvinyltransferase